MEKNIATPIPKTNIEATPKHQRQINQVQTTEDTSDPLVSMIQKVQNYN